MPRMLVSGLINIETTLKVDGFPVTYAPVRFPFFGVNSTVSGVGYNLSKALTRLGDEVRFLSLIGRDAGAQLVQSALQADGIDASRVLNQVENTAQSVILYDPQGQRSIFTDLKDIQQQTYPEEVFDPAAEGCDLLALCNINFSRSLLARAKRMGKRIATDVHTISRLDDEYNRDFMQAADILFMSDELLPVSPEEWALQLQSHFGTEIIVIGLGSKGALLAVKSQGILERLPAVSTRPVVNTIGAGDALFSAFLHGYAQTGDAYRALQRATVFASYKIGTAGAAEGFLDATGLEQLCQRVLSG